ncbi:MAG TPA: hypothetical protein VED46_15155 [Alphaproteobacteria bacterium]|nr:hypothetical protein [Alphaproteobacteria bacterium]
MPSYTIITREFDRTPEGYRREIRRLRRLVKAHPDDWGYRSALQGMEKVEAMSEALEANPAFAEIVGRAIAKLKARRD